MREKRDDAELLEFPLTNCAVARGQTNLLNLFDATKRE